LDQSIDTEDETTEILYGAENVIKFNLQRFSRIKQKHDALLESAWPSVIFTIAQPIKLALIELHKKGIKQRLITEITTDNIEYCKELLKFTDEVRHIDGIKGNFSVSDGKEYVAAAIIQEEQDITQLIFSNVKQIVEQHQHLFETLWSKAVPAEDRIKEIELGIKPDNIETIKDPVRTQNLYLNLVKSAKTELMLIIPTTNAVNRQSYIGLHHLIKELITDGKVQVRILAPQRNDNDDKITNHSQDILTSYDDALNIQIRNIEASSATQSTIAIVDRKQSLAIEIKDDSKERFTEAMGFATYSNSRPTVLSYVSIFEGFWIQTELYKKLKDTEQMQKEFFNVAAHELRNPVQPILGLIDIVRRNEKDLQQKQLLDIIARNAKKLQQLTEDVLDVAKIEAHSLQINKEEFDLDDLIKHIVEDYKSELTSNKRIKLVYESDTRTSANNINRMIVADKTRIGQVISNLISNAAKFTSENGIVSIKLRNDADHDGFITVIVRDSGTGIHHKVMSRLFTKFATMPGTGTGTGLGLFISKSIIEAHGGRMWGENNQDEKGATFSFSLPCK
jgi:signal transduction histidine kinase